VRHQGQQLGAEQVDVAATLLLVAQDPVQPEQHHRRRVRVDLDRASLAAGAGVHVQSEGRAQPGAAGAVAELRLAGVGRVRAGVVAAEVLAQRLLGGPRPGGVGDDERRVDRDQARPFDVRRQRGHDLLVGAHGAHVQQPGARVEDRETGGLPAAPGKVDPHEVHSAKPTSASCCDE
jgi:hypothetical protein